MSARRRLSFLLAAGSIAVALQVAPRVAQAQSTDPSFVIGSGCSSAEALVVAKQYSAAVETYVAVLRVDPTQRCAIDGLVSVAASTKSPPVNACEVAASLHAARADEEARAVLVEAMKKGARDCGDGRTNLKGLNKKSRPDRIAEWFACAGKVAPLVLLAIVALVFLLPRVPPFRRRFRWIFGPLLRPQVVFDAFGDPSAEPKAAAGLRVTTIAALQSVTESSSSSAGAPSLDTVDAFSELSPAVTELGKVAPVLEPVDAALRLLWSWLPRVRLKVFGQLHPAGSDEPGLTLQLERDGRRVSGDTLWGSSCTDPAEEDFLALAVPAGAWISHAAAEALGSELPTSALGFAWLTAAVDAETRHDVERALACYERSLEADPTHAPTLEGWVLARAKREQDFARRVQILRMGLRRLESNGE